MKTELYDYQQEGVSALRKFKGRALLADEMGLGKTIQGLAFFRKYHKRMVPAVVVCPAALKWNWQREAKMHIGCRAEVLEGRTPPKKGRIKSKPRLVIINYEILPYWPDWFEELNPQLIMIDECQYIKNMSAQRTKATKHLCRGVKHVIGMSGTPLISRPAELYPILNILKPKIYNSFMSYAWQFCKPRRTPWNRWEYKGATNLDVLNKQLKRDGMIRRLKKDVLTQLPDKTRTVIPISLGPDERREYDYAEKEFLTWLAKTSGKSKASKAKKAQRLVKMGYLKRLAAQLKYGNVVDWVDDFFDDNDGKLILFGVHKKMLQPLAKRYRSKCVLVDGSIKGRHRQGAVDKFQSRDRTRLFIGNIQAAGVGLTLTAAHNLAFCELGWTPGEHTQAEDRPHRIGQENAVMCYYLVARNTIEEDLCRIIQEKQAVLEATLDGAGAGDDLDIFRLLAKALRKRGIK